MNKKRILVVDDETNMCEALFDVLEQEGFRVTTASNRDEALGSLSNIDFDLVLLDIRLRGGDGIDLIQAIREIKPDVAIIIMTGYPSLESAIEATRLGVSDYLLKPISVESLKASIENVLFHQAKEKDKSRLAKRLEEANENLARMQETLNQSMKMAALGKIGPGLFHEVKNLLGVMNVSLYYLKKNLDIKDLKTQKHIDIIEKEIQHSNNIIMGLLNFSRAKEDKIVPADINQLIEEAVVLLEHELTLRGIKIIKDYACALPCVALEPNQIKQVFINLILNAREAMPRGGELRIVSQRAEDPAFVSIKFIDTGCGIEKENREKIFNPFFTTKDNAGGMGLGLAVSREIIERHKGTISVESEEEKGAVFSIELPSQESRPDILKAGEKSLKER